MQIASARGNQCVVAAAAWELSIAHRVEERSELYVNGVMGAEPTLVRAVASSNARSAALVEPFGAILVAEDRCDVLTVLADRLPVNDVRGMGKRSNGGC